MKINIKLTFKEKNIINKLLLPHRQQAMFKQSIERLLQEWANFVEQVESGYNFTSCEYDNDLWKRDILEEIIQGSPKVLSEKLVKVINPLDNRFKKATHKINKPLSPSIEHKSFFWWHRIPKKLIGDLKRDFEFLRILK